MTGKNLVFTTKCLESFAKYDPVSSSLKTLQLSFAWVDTTYSEPLPQQGMMQSGVLYELGQILVCHTSDAGGSVWPTPTASDVKRAKITPCDLRATERGKGLALPAAVLKSVTLPTPTAKLPSMQPHHPSAWRRRRIHNNGAMLPIVICENLNITEAEALRRHARLNPLFVEAMMGFPIDWTEPPSQNTTDD